MVKHLIDFLRNKRGALSVEFAGIFLAFLALTFVIYDVYSSIMLQNKLERVTYTVASTFRERTSLYPLVDDTVGGTAASVCHKSATNCFKSFEIMTEDQVTEIRALANKLLDRDDIAVQIDALYLAQQKGSTAERVNTQAISTSLRSCPVGGCGDVIDYFNDLPDMADKISTTHNYTELSPFSKRLANLPTGLTGRWVPLYRVNMCIANNESLYLALFQQRERKDSGGDRSLDILPNLCAEATVVSRCNDSTSPIEGCPIYFF